MLLYRRTHFVIQILLIKLLVKLIKFSSQLFYFPAIHIKARAHAILRVTLNNVYAEG